MLERTRPLSFRTNCKESFGHLPCASFDGTHSRLPELRTNAEDAGYVPKTAGSCTVLMILLHLLKTFVITVHDDCTSQYVTLTK